MFADEVLFLEFMRDWVILFEIWNGSEKDLTFI